MPAIPSAPSGPGSTVTLTAAGGLPALDGSLLTGVVAASSSQRYTFQVGGALNTPTLPLADLALEIVSIAQTLTTLQGRRGVVGTAGTTTATLFKNGVTTGYSLSWTNADAAFSLKTAVISVAVAVGDRLTLTLASAEAGASDVYLEAF